MKAASSSPSSSPPPRWARVADAVCLIIAAVSVVIALSGGFRVRLGGWRFALTSPLRLLAWAFVIGAIRHAITRQTPIYSDLPARIMKASRTPAARAASAAFAGTRPIILFVGYLAVFMFGLGSKNGIAPWRVADNEFVNLQARWDTGWYLGVAIDGYDYDPEHPEDQHNIVFFPGYPILMRVAGRLLGGASTAYLLGGTLISLGAFFWALTYLYRFARDTLAGDDEARATVWLLAAYPFALFFGAVYTESLFLLGVVAAFYHFRRGEYLGAGLWGLLVGLTRPLGFALAVPLGLIALTPWTPASLAGGHAAADSVSTSRRVVAALASAAMPVVGLLLYSAFTWQLSGHPLAWKEGQFAWGRQYTGLGKLVTDRVDVLSHAGLYAYTTTGSFDLLNGLGALFVIVTAWPVARRLGLAYAVFILINILPPLAEGGFLSAGRFSAVLFPSFVWLGAAVPSRWRTAWVAAFMAVQALNAALFYTWRPLY